jgi:uncharacterized membrane protein
MTMHADKYFTAEEQEKIQQAVAAAEQRTSGEIVPMIVAASSRYAETDLTCLIAGLLLGTVVALIWGDPWDSHTRSSPGRSAAPHWACFFANSLP